MKLRRYTIKATVPTREVCTGTLLTTVLELERLGATEHDVERISLLAADESYTPRDQAFTVRRLV